MSHSTSNKGNPRLGTAPRLALRLLVLGAVGYTTWCIGVYTIQDRLIFPRNLTPKANRTLDAHDGETIWIDLPNGGRVEGWFLRGFGLTKSKPGPAVLYAHGNAELIEHNLERAKMYQEMGVSVLLAEYRGYGRSDGEPSEAGIGEDFAAFRRWLEARPEVDAKKLIYHGRSLGGGVVLGLAKVAPPAVIIVESTFLSVAARSWSYGVPEWVCKHPFRNDEAIAAYDGPVLVMHGPLDNIVPIEEGRKLAALAKRGTFVELAGDHVNFPSDERAYERTVQEFLQKQGLVRLGAARP